MIVIGYRIGRLKGRIMQPVVRPPPGIRACPQPILGPITISMRSACKLQRIHTSSGTGKRSPRYLTLVSMVVKHAAEATTSRMADNGIVVGWRNKRALGMWVFIRIGSRRSVAR